MKYLSYIIVILLLTFKAQTQNVGIGTTTPLARLHVADSNVLYSAAGDIPATPGNTPVSGAGRRVMWYADKAAFRAGYVETDNWNKDSIGNYSVAMGYDTKAIGYGTTAIGAFTTASGLFSMALGYNSIASSTGSFAAGFLTKANGINSTAMGSNAKATGNYSIAIGIGVIASGESSIAFGSECIANGINSTTTGELTAASGTHSTATGRNTFAKANSSFTIGRFNENTDNPDPTNLDPDDRIFQIGNGVNLAVRSNALTVLRNGNTGIGTVSPGAKLHVVSGTSGYVGGNFPGITLEGSGNTYFNILSPNSSETGLLFGKASDAAAGGIVYNNAGNPNSLDFRTNGNITRMLIYSNGNAWLQGTLTQASDVRLKKDISALQNPLQKLIQLNGYTYHWKNENDDNRLQTGVLAQEVQKLFPELVAENKEGILAVNYSGLIPVIIESIKEQQKIIEKQQKQIDELRKHFKQFIKQ